MRVPLVLLLGSVLLVAGPAAAKSPQSPSSDYGRVGAILVSFDSNASGASSLTLDIGDYPSALRSEQYVIALSAGSDDAAASQLEAAIDGNLGSSFDAALVGETAVLIRPKDADGTIPGGSSVSENDACLNVAINTIPVGTSRNVIVSLDPKNASGDAEAICQAGSETQGSAAAGAITLTLRPRDYAPDQPATVYSFDPGASDDDADAAAALVAQLSAAGVSAQTVGASAILIHTANVSDPLDLACGSADATLGVACAEQHHPGLANAAAPAAAWPLTTALGMGMTFLAMLAMRRRAAGPDRV